MIHLNNDEIKAYRARLGLSRAELSRRLPVPYRTLEDWENGASGSTPYLWRALRDLEAEIKGRR